MVSLYHGILRDVTLYSLYLPTRLYTNCMYVRMQVKVAEVNKRRSE